MNSMLYAELYIWAFCAQHRRSICWQVSDVVARRCYLGRRPMDDMTEWIKCVRIFGFLICQQKERIVNHYVSRSATECIDSTYFSKTITSAVCAYYTYIHCSCTAEKRKENIFGAPYDFRKGPTSIRSIGRFVVFICCGSIIYSLNLGILVSKNRLEQRVVSTVECIGRYVYASNKKKNG